MMIFFFLKRLKWNIYISEGNDTVPSAQDVPRISARDYKRVPRSNTIKTIKYN
jgi:hypothetical protein